MKTAVLRSLLLATVLAVFSILPTPAAAHCDTLNGPVVSAARLALKTGDLTPVLKWVKKDQEPEVRAAFERALKVRSQSNDAKELADTYFFETLVRVHRAGEGAPYTGLKAAGELDPAVAAADRALETGSIDAFLNSLTQDIANGIRQRFARVQQAAKHADESVAAGREYVESYVELMHYLERLHQAGSAHDTHLPPEVAASHPH